MPPASGLRAEDLRPIIELERPVWAEWFVRRRYMAFRIETVDNLIRYYMGVIAVWDAISDLRAGADVLRAGSSSDQIKMRARVEALLTTMRHQLSLIEVAEAPLLQELRIIAALPDRPAKPESAPAPEL